MRSTATHRSRRRSGKWRSSDESRTSTGFAGRDECLRRLHAALRAKALPLAPHPGARTSAARLRFGVEQDTPRGALTFLRTARALLASSQNAVWLTPQGRFMDVRERPLRLKDGLGALATREPSAAFIPLAIEFAFWTESRPEILVSFRNRPAVWKGRAYAPVTAT